MTTHPTSRLAMVIDAAMAANVRQGALRMAVAMAAGVLAGLAPAADQDNPARPGPDALPELLVTGRSGNGATWDRLKAMDEARDAALLPAAGATTYQLDRDDIGAQPDGLAAPLKDVLLQMPGVSSDSAASNTDFHIRNEYANLQYRIDGIQLPDGVSGLGQVLDTGIVGRLKLLDGALPAQYGLHTAGVIEITTPAEFAPGGVASLRAGSFATLSPALEYGGTGSQTRYFLMARHVDTDEGLESATPGHSPLHDHSSQDRVFGYASTLLDAHWRMSWIAGGAWSGFQVPAVAGRASAGDYGSAAYSSARLNETESDGSGFAVLALQYQAGGLDAQLAAYTRYAAVHYVPDVYGDLVFNDLAANVSRQSTLSGLQFDGALPLAAVHTLRIGAVLASDHTRVDDTATVLPLGTAGTPLPQPGVIDDRSQLTGWTAGAYLQDEWAAARGLTLTGGVRFDAMDQFVRASQWSPRFAAVWHPAADTTLHAGYARYFTPPVQSEATPSRLALFNGTSAEAAIPLASPVLPERSHYVDLGIDQELATGLSAGLDGYYKRATDLQDDGQFGQAAVLTQFNLQRGASRGLELKVQYRKEGLHAYAGVAYNRTEAINVVSNQYLYDDPIEFRYLATHWHSTDDDQRVSASAGVSWRGENDLLSLSGVYGSGLHSGFANLDHEAGYTQWNLGAEHRLPDWSGGGPPSARLSVINLFDRSYLLRSGTGIGEFAPQYGPRRGLFLTLSQPV